MCEFCIQEEAQNELHFLLECANDKEIGKDATLSPKLIT